jgi:hypothetical protein
LRYPEEHSLRIVRLTDGESCAIHSVPTSNIVTPGGGAPPVFKNLSTAALNVPWAIDHRVMNFMDNPHNVRCLDCVHNKAAAYLLV